MQRFDTTRSLGARGSLLRRLLGKCRLLVRNLLRNHLHYADDQGIAHTKGTFGVAHPFGPATRKAIEFFELVGNQPTTLPSSRIDDVLEARRRRSAFCRENRSRRAFQGIRKWKSPFGVEVRCARTLVDSFLVLRTLEILPHIQLVRG